MLLWIMYSLCAPITNKFEDAIINTETIRTYEHSVEVNALHVN